MLKEKIIILFLLLTGCLLSAAVQPIPDALPAEKTAQRELTEAIKHFPANVLPEIVLKYDKTLGAEEFVISRSGNNAVVISGGRPRGVLYGALEFMEKAMGIRFCSLDYTYIPKKLPMVLPSDFQWCGKPAFFIRNYYDIYLNKPLEKFQRYHVYNRMNAASDLPEHGFSQKVGRPRGCHTFLYYCEDLPEEYGWMNPAGKRVKVTHTAGGQICYSLPAVRSHVIAKLKKYIAQDRQECDKTGAPYPVIYDISANDCNAACHCQPCKVFAEKHNVSGLVLNFINQIAAEIIKTHPEIKIQTFAYKDTIIPPKGNIQAAKNVIINCAFMDMEFGAGSNSRDVLRPLANPQQKWYKEQLQTWKKYASNIAIWDYWKLYYESVPNPKGAIRDRAEYIKFYHQLGVSNIFIEAEIDDEKSMVSFADLRSYQAAKLMWNPALNANDLINDYMTAFYGKAASAMIKYLDLLEKSMAKENAPLGHVDVRNRKYLNSNFFQQAHHLLDEAEKLATGDQIRLNHIAQERLIVDITEATLKGTFTPGQQERIRKNYTAYVKKYFNTSHFQRHAKSKCNNLIAGINRPPLPEKFRFLPVKDLCWSDFSLTVTDSTAAGGRCLSWDREMKRLKKKNTPEMHKRDLQFGVYDRKNRKHIYIESIPKNKLPQDEKFHIYNLGKAPLNEDCVLWAHWTWYVGSSLRALADSSMPDRPGEIYVSMKVQGPSYVTGSKSLDDVRIDRIFYVPWNPDLIRKSLPELPAELNAGKNFRQLAYCDFTGYTADSDAAGGYSIKLSTAAKRYKKKPDHNFDLMFGIYDPQLKKKVTPILTVPKANLPQDEKFHYYYLGRVKFGKGALLWLHQSWYLGTSLKELVTDANESECDVYISIKLQGPSYVKKSVKIDDIALDRIVSIPVAHDTAQVSFAPGSLIK